MSDYSLIPDEKRKTAEYMTDNERTAHMKLVFAQGYFAALLTEMENYLKWMEERRAFRREKIRWKWKIFFFKTFMSNYKRRLHDLDRLLAKIKYQPPK